MSNNTNTTTYNLLVPFEDKDIVKKLGAKWDFLNKNWYFVSDLENSLPEELKKYKAYPVHVEYEDKDIFKSKYKSLRWNPTKKNWLCNETDYRHITA
jgi:hypothetical protein